MKITLDTSRVIPFLKRNCNKRTIGLFSLYAVLIALAIGGAFAKPILRDFAIANIAHAKAGDKIPFEEFEPGYTRNELLPRNAAFGMKTNSLWLADQIRLIVPYFAYEHVAPLPRYPNIAGVLPLRGDNSFHLGGRMSTTVGGTMIIINERYVMDSRWNDKRKALSTLVHELIHVQGGAYLSGTSAQRETATQSATAEVLAGMCNHNNEVACRAFWKDIENWARTSLELQLKDYGLEGIYNAWASTFWNDNEQDTSYAKSRRHWAELPGQLENIQRKYSLGPWQNIIVGVVDGTPLNTLHVYCYFKESLSCGAPNPETQVCKILGMPYDDTFQLMKYLQWILK